VSLAVGLARQQRFDLLLVTSVLQLLERRLGLGDDIRIALLLAHLDELEIVGELGFERFRPLIESSRCCRSRISFCASCASSQIDGSSALEFSHSRRF
jgi:hypothetical protein